MRRWIVSLCLLILVLPARAHLCNDVFAQARDNLAVKVDIRDGQLRINKEASFRVYLLNTMDRIILNIQLEVVSPNFDAVVTPSPEWKGFPALQTSLQGGKKEYFNVTLTRKNSTPDGKYNIGLRLFNGKRPTQEFKTIDIADAMSVVKVPRRPLSLKVDGKITRAEWAEAALCTDFTAETKKGGYRVKQEPDSEMRVRFAADNNTLYALVTSPDAGAHDTLSLFFAPDADAKPTRIDVDLKSGELKDAPKSALSFASHDGIEIQFPLRDLNLAKSFLLNLSHEKNGRLSVWRGNCASLQNPIVYANMILGD